MWKQEKQVHKRSHKRATVARIAEKYVAPLLYNYFHLHLQL